MSIYAPFETRQKIDRTDLYWLAYLIFFVIQPVMRHSVPYWIENVAIMAGFIVLYVTYLRSTRQTSRILLIALMAALGIAVLPFNGGAAAFTIYAAALLPFTVLSPAVVLVTDAALAIILGVEAHLLHFDAFSLFINVFFTLVVGATNLHFAQKARADCKVRMQQEEIEALAAVAERERIARDLHDVLGHTLSVIVLKSELANRLLQRELARTEASTSPVQPQTAIDLPTLERAQTEIADVERTARTALAEVREAIGGYRARGLSAEIEAARSTLASAGVTLHTEGDLRPANLTAAEETVLSLALREAVTNIVRHAQATTCRLRLVHQDGRHRLSIEDNGQHTATREGNGLRGMRERVESLGGHLSLTREAGTLLQIDLPQRAT